MFKRIFAAFLLMISVPAFASRLAVLTDPPPIQVPSGLSNDQIAKAIIAGMDKRHWTAESSKPGEIVAVQAPRDVVAKVKIAYDSKTITISYFDSTNFLYEEHDGKREIHEKYNSWVTNLSKDIQDSLAAGSAMSQAAPSSSK